jgi:ligand-binding SRPBCC domain-containing protein
MIRLELQTRIFAPVERCFDLARSIDVELASSSGTRVQAISGVTSGLIGPDEEVTWKTRFFGIPVTHTSQITAFRFPNYFQDSMVRGALQTYCHNHYFETNDDVTLMKDSVSFSAPYGFLGKLAEWLFVERHLRGLLEQRNEFIKRTAESSGWTKFLKA